MTGVVIVGAGHAGLCTAVVLRRHGLPCVILDRADQVGSSWRSRYRALRLNTERWGSRLPGLPIPRGAGRWPSASEFADYLESYARHHDLRPRFGVECLRVDPAPDGGCLLTTSDGPLCAPAVIMTTGPDREPRLPNWPGLADFAGRFLHTAHYHSPEPYAGARVLVVGGGESGADIAVDLARSNAGPVWLSVRTAPYITRPNLLGIPAQALAILARPQPPWLFDANAEFMRRLQVGDLSRYGLHRPPGLHQSARVVGKAPILDRGFLDLVRDGRIRVVPAVTAVRGTEAVLADGGTLPADVIIAATGYTPGLDTVVGHLGLLGPDGRPTVHGPVTAPTAPSLFFAGYTPVLTGNIRAAHRTADQIARVLRHRLHRTEKPVVAWKDSSP